MASTIHSSNGNGNGTALRERPLGELLGRLADQVGTLVSDEIELAKAELVEKGRRAGRGVGLLAGAAIVGFLGLACVTACIVLALALAMDGWAAALIVGIAYLGGAAALATVAKEQIDRATPPVPEEAIESVKEDVQWAKAALR